MTLPISFDQNWKEEFIHRLHQNSQWDQKRFVDLALQAQNQLTIDEFSGLAAKKYLNNFSPLPHQLQTAETVIEKMNGRAILADEVGLGKTIEAGLILKEYMIRGLVKKVLILTPASLVNQWVHELQSKFHIPAVAQRKSYMWEQYDCIVSSLDTAKRSPHKEIILNQEYDFILIDEAHKLKNHQTKNYAFIQAIKKKFCLLLTATPIQNKINEIFHLVSLLKPGHLGNHDQFKNLYAKKEDSVKQLVNKVMIRNRRIDTGIKWSSRVIKPIIIDFSTEEKQFYSLLDQATHIYSEPLIKTTLLREACSSKESVLLTLEKLVQKNQQLSEPSKQEFQSLFSQVEKMTVNSKAEKTLELIRSINDKVIIFTEYRATQLYLQWFLQQNGIKSVPFRGGFKGSKKDWMRELFQKNVDVLIATEAGSEGINLQFCHHLINYDLPWNPMKLEQRIGRIHRLGQNHDVHIYNLVIKQTIEERVFHLLLEKIKLFEKVIGDLDEILISNEQVSFNEYVEEIFAHSNTEGELKIKLDNLSAYIHFLDEMNEKSELKNVSN